MNKLKIKVNKTIGIVLVMLSNNLWAHTTNPRDPHAHHVIKDEGYIMEHFAIETGKLESRIYCRLNKTVREREH